jgi:Zn-dependent peptidase ImmA (M78 family)/transcriptional regulator with XRE-family HTH domain
MISSQRLGERLAAARKRAKLTQAHVAEGLGLARTTVVAIEKGERRPSNAELVALTEILGIGIHDLLREGSVVAEASPRLRRIGASRDDAAVTATVERLRKLGARYVELERLHGLQRRKAPLEALASYRLDEPGASPDARLEGEDAARTVRGMLGLGDEPAVALDDRLESEAGLRIFHLDGLPPSLCAVLVWSEVLGACVAINAAHPHERRRWSLAHELACFLRDREAGDVLETTARPASTSEAFSEAFTKEFLLPATGVHKRFAERCRAGKFTPVDIHAMARAFGVSFVAMTRRLEELRLLPRGTYDRIKQSSLSAEESMVRYDPTVRNPAEQRSKLPDMYVALAISAYDQALLSEMELAEHLETDVVTARFIYQSNNTIALDESMRIAVDLTGADLRRS